MSMRRFSILSALIAMALAAQAGFVYETPREFFSSGDFNGDGIPDVLVLDKLSGNARVGYGDGAGALTWSAPLATGVENVTGCAVGSLLQTSQDAIAVTSPGFNLVSIVDVSETNSAGAPQTFAPAGLGPHAVAALGASFLLVASSDNDGGAEVLDLTMAGGAPVSNTSFPETGPFDRANGLALDSSAPSLGVGIVRGATNDALHVWQFTNAPAVLLAWTNLAPGSDYAFGNFNGEPLPRFIFYQPGDTNLFIVPLLQTNGALAFGDALEVTLDEPVQEVIVLTNGAIIQFGDGVQGLTLSNGSAVLSSKYQSGAGAAGNVFTGIMALANGQFALLDAAPGAASTGAQIITFDGMTFTQRSASTLPHVTSRNGRPNVWLFQLEPFVHRAPGFVASLNSPDWVDGVSGLPGSVQAVTEGDFGAAGGLGNAVTSNLGAPPPGSAFATGNQYHPAISIFAYSPVHAVEPVLVSIAPPPGSYGSPLTLQFTASPANSGVRYRVNSAGAWRNYAGPFVITNDATVQYYGTNSSGARASLQCAAYSLGAPLTSSPPPPAVIGPTNTNAPPSLNTNQVVISQGGTLFYGRRAGGIWAINLDGSADTYITQGFRPHGTRDGRRLAFLRNTNEFWIRDLQSGSERMLATAPSAVTDFEWETNGAALLTDYGCAIGDLDTNGGFTSLLTVDCYSAAPTRSPADGSIAFHDLNPSGHVAGIYVGGQRVVTSVYGASWPSWSPDGANLAFRDSAQNLWVADASGAQPPAQISGFSDKTNGFPYGALWLPDGEGVVFAGTVFDTNGLWVVPLRSDRQTCDGPPYRLPTTPGDAIDFAGSIVLAPTNSAYTGPQPSLFIRQTPTNVVVYWNTNPAGFTLESESNLLSPSWTPVAGPFYLNGAYIEYWESLADLQFVECFRLRYTGAAVQTQGPPP
jgi:hypothetical protein